MSQKFTNAARSPLMANIVAGDTSITVDASLADLFPVADTNAGAVPTAGKDFFKVVLEDSNHNLEIVYVRTRALGTATFSNCIRGQEGTTARSYLVGSIVGLRYTAQDLAGAIDLASSATVAGKSVLNAANAAAQRAALGVAASGANSDITSLLQSTLTASITASAVGTANAITASFTPAITMQTAFMTLYVRAASANTTATPTFTPNSGTVEATVIVKGNSLPLAVGDIAGAGHVLCLQRDSVNSNWVLQNPAASFADSGVTAGTYGSASAVPVVTVDSKGRITSASTATISASLPGILGQAFAASGTFTVPTGVTALKVTVVGGGGGGGASIAGACSPASGGVGGSGGCGVKFITGLTPGSTVTVTVGSAGAGGGAGATGGSGGTTSFGGYATATGGSGGGAGGGVYGVAGAPGSASVSDYVMQVSGSSNSFGAGGYAVYGNSNGMAAPQGYGGGGAGGYSASNGAAWMLGGAGRIGFVLVEW